MKRFLLLVAVIATCFAIQASAQIKFGVKGGLNITDMSFSKDVVNTSNKTGFFIGPTVKFKIPVIGIGFDVAALYDQREAKTKDVYDETGAPCNQTLKQQAINIPINLRYDLGLGDLAGVYFAAGPQFGFNIGDKSKTLWDDASEWKLKSSTLSVNLGAGVMLLKHLQIGANYNIVCGKTGEITFTDGVKTAYKGKANTWQISAAYYF